jgi:anti-sigma factor RsiW
MLRCRGVVELLDEYLEGALDPAVAARLEAHLADCGDCTAFLETYRAVVRSSRQLRESQLPAELRERLLSFLREHHEA